MTNSDFLNLLRSLIEAVRDENKEQNEKLTDLGIRLKLQEEMAGKDHQAFVRRLNEHTRMIAKIQKALPNERELKQQAREKREQSRAVKKNEKFREKAMFILKIAGLAGAAIWATWKYMVLPVLKARGIL